MGGEDSLIYSMIFEFDSICSFEVARVCGFVLFYWNKVFVN